MCFLLLSLAQRLTILQEFSQCGLVLFRLFGAAIRKYTLCAGSTDPLARHRLDLLHCPEALRLTSFPGHLHILP